MSWSYFQNSQHGGLETMVASTTLWYHHCHLHDLLENLFSIHCLTCIVFHSNDNPIGAHCHFCMSTLKTEVQGLNINSRIEVAIEGWLPSLKSLLPILSCVLPTHHYFSLLCLLSFYNALLNPHKKVHFLFWDLSFFISCWDQCCLKYYHALCFYTSLKRQPTRADTQPIHCWSLFKQCVFKCKATKITLMSIWVYTEQSQVWSPHATSLFSFLSFVSAGWTKPWQVTGKGLWLTVWSVQRGSGKEKELWGERFRVKIEMTC